MRRRDIIVGLGGAAAAWPCALHAQQPSRTRRVGVLFGGSESDPFQKARIAAFRQGLRDLKWIAGESVKLETRYGEGNDARIKAGAADLVALAPDVIVAATSPAAKALQQATHTIAIVMAGISDPIGDGLVQSLARPGGNITGFSSMDSALAGKWLQLLREMSPRTVRVVALFNPDTAPHSVFWPALEASAASQGVTLVRTETRDRAAIESAIAALAGNPANGLALIPDSFTTTHRGPIIALAARHRVPAVYALKSFAVDGGLMAYGPDFVDITRRAAGYVDNILKGAKPADLPVQNPTKFEFVLNLKTAKALGLAVPPLLLAQADEVIE